MESEVISPAVSDQMAIADVIVHPASIDPTDPQKIAKDEVLSREENNVEEQFIFREEEFENDQFNAAQFVAKYRRVSSLDSLREQLREYCQSLKDQLYVIINRDYKDFITIATKLDGVDDRVEHLRQPLVDLRMSLSALFDGLVASKQAIQEKFKHKAEISNRRRLIEASLLCLSQLELSEEVLNTSVPAAQPEPQQLEGGVPAAASKRRALMHVIHLAERAKNGAASGGSAVAYAKARELFECSEYERAANSLSVALKCVDTIRSLGSSTSSSATSMASTAAFAKSVEQRAKKAVEALILRVKNRMEDMLAVIVSASKTASSSSSSEGEDTTTTAVAAATAVVSISPRPFSHCLRALIQLGRGDVAESVVSETVVLPLARAALTQGRVDGIGGRGSFAGLKQALDGLIADLRTAMITPFMLAESVVHSAVGLILASTTEDRDDVVAASQAPNTVPLDLIVNGVWAPVVNHLAEKFPNMFSVGIAETFYTAYTAVEGFTSALSGLLEVEGGATREALGLAERLKTHSALLAFHAKWKLDLYYQLRSNEISARFEKGLQTLLLPNGIDRGSTESVYGASGETLSKADISHLQSMLDIERFQLVASRVLLTELATCLHKNVMLPAQASRFLGLVVQLLLKLQGVIATIVNGTAISSLGVGNVTAPSLSAVTPAKAVSSVASTPALSANTAAPIASQALSFSNEDLLALTADLEKIGDWIETFFVPHCEQMLPYRQVVTKASPVSRLLTTQAAGIRKIMLQVWNKLNVQLSNECKVPLQAVRAVAGKYRMTNKPPPESASSYVKTVLQPLRGFLEKHSSSVPLTVLPEWVAECIEAVTTVYLQQVKELMETAKQMDSALQRRSKLRSTNTAAGGAAVADKPVLGDSEKISLQIYLDVLAFGEEVRGFDLQPEELTAYRGLLEEVAEARLLTAK